MAETEIKLYNGQYTGAQIDAAVGGFQTFYTEFFPGFAAHLLDTDIHLSTAQATSISETAALASKLETGLAAEVTANGKNILENRLISLTKNGVTGTVNRDGSITLTGTSTKTSAFVLCYDMYDGTQSNSYTTKRPIAPGTYVCKGTGDSRVKVQAWGYTDSSDCDAYTNATTDTEFTVTTKPYISYRLYIAASADFATPLTIYPMVAPKAAWDVSSAYVAHIPTQAEIAQDAADFTRYANPVPVVWFGGIIKPSDGTVDATGDNPTNYHYTNLFKIRKGQRLVWSGTGPSTISQITKYKNGAFVAALIDGSVETKLRYYIPTKFWIADEDCEIRICHRVTASGSSHIVADDDVNPVVYNDEQFLSGSPLWGKKMVVFGDSLVHGSRLDEYPTWATWLGAKYRMTVINEGINGSAIAEIPQASIDADGGDEHDPIVDRYQDVLRANPDADIVVVEGGANDRTQAVPVGTVDSTDKTEFTGACNRIINGTRILCPQAKIFFINLPWRWTTASSLGLRENDYADAMEAVCKAKSIPCRSPLYEGDIDFRDSYVAAWADEGLWIGETANRHYSPPAYQYILPRIERFLSE